MMDDETSTDPVCKFVRENGILVVAGVSNIAPNVKGAKLAVVCTLVVTISKITSCDPVGSTLIPRNKSIFRPVVVAYNRSRMG